MSPDHQVLRSYLPDDLPAVQRMWREVGWIDDSDAQAAAVGWFFDAGHAEVGEVEGEVECAVHWSDGELHHQETDLPLAAITAVTTSLVGRKLGMASQLTARAVAAAAGAGAAVATLGMFEQGFYDRVGFGSGPYEHRITVDPTRLRVPVPYRRPSRLTADHADEIHAALAGRARAHGGVVLHAADLVRAELAWTEGILVGLGYRDDAGSLTHCLVGSMADEQGPLKIRAIAYRDVPQLLELLRLLQELGDQVASIRLIEPPELQLMDLIHQPFRAFEQAKGGATHGFLVEAFPWWQARIIDLERCIGALRGVGEAVQCNLVLDDPAAAYLDGGWAGVGGTYTLTVADPSTIRAGSTDGLPTLTASVGALTRWWLGVGSASRLSATSSFAAPPALLADLDRAVTLPAPFPGWDH